MSKEDKIAADTSNDVVVIAQVFHSNQTDKDYTDNLSIVTISPSEELPPPVASLSVSQSASDVSPTIGSEITLTTRVKNIGPATATGVVIKVSIPARFEILEENNTKGDFVPSTSFWTIGDIQAHGEETLYLTVRIH